MSARFGRPRPPADDASGTPLDGLLEEMRDLRLTLAADLTAAAGAADAGADDVAAEIVEADRKELARFFRVADQRLLRLQKLAGEAPAETTSNPRWRRRVVVALPVVPVVGALAVSAAAATGVLTIPHGATHKAPPVAAAAPVATTPVNSSFLAFADVVGSDPSASQVIAAAHRLHKQLAQLIATSPNDPGSAAQIAELLRMEQSLLLREQPPGASVVLDATRKLAKRLDNVTPQVAPTTVPTDIPTLAPSEKPHRSSSSPTPSKSSSPTPKPTRSSSPQPTSDPSSSPSDGPILIP